MLEGRRNYYTVIVWVGDVLHVANCNVGDSDGYGEGMDITDPAELLQWLVSDRFPGDQGAALLLEYCRWRGIDLTEDPHGPRAPDSVIIDGVELVFTGHQVHVHDGPWGGRKTAYQISGWRALVLQLIRDRCEGRNAWARVSEQLMAAGIIGRDKWRGYM